VFGGGEGLDGCCKTNIVNTALLIVKAYFYKQTVRGKHCHARYFGQVLPSSTSPPPSKYSPDASQNNLLSDLYSQQNEIHQSYLWMTYERKP